MLLPALHETQWNKSSDGKVLKYSQLKNYLHAVDINECRLSS